MPLFMGSLPGCLSVESLSPQTLITSTFLESAASSKVTKVDACWEPMAPGRTYAHLMVDKQKHWPKVAMLSNFSG